MLETQLKPSKVPLKRAVELEGLRTPHLKIGAKRSLLKQAKTAW